MTRLPTDSHVHSEWSWDAIGGSMERTCARAVEIGLPALAFTEHLDHTVWTVEVAHLEAYSHLATLVDNEGRLAPPAFDVEGYQAEVARCRDLFPTLRILTGAEVGEPHWHADAVAGVLGRGTFDRVLGSLHCLPLGASEADGYAEPPGLFATWPADDVLRAYWAEAARLVSDCDSFTVLAHVDYPLNYWPRGEPPFDVHRFEDDLRHVLRCTAGSGKALEVNTKVPLHAEILGWWREEGGETITFASDAHSPDGLARGFHDAVALAEATGFRAGADPLDLWHL